MKYYKVSFNRAFEKCKRLKIVEFPKNADWTHKIVSFIETFYFLPSIETVILPKNLNKLKSIYGICNSCKKLTSFIIVQAPKLRRMTSSFSDCSELEEFIIPESLSFCNTSKTKEKTIGGRSRTETIERPTVFSCMFQNSTKLRNVEFRCRILGDVAFVATFHNCPNLETVSFPGCDCNTNDLRKNNPNALYSCYAKSLESIYSGCTKLREFSLPKNIDIGHLESMNEMCYNCSSLIEVDLSFQKYVITNNAIRVFMNCRSLQRVIFPYNFRIKIDGLEIFEGCQNLRYIKGTWLEFQSDYHFTTGNFDGCPLLEAASSKNSLEIIKNYNNGTSFQVVRFLGEFQWQRRD